MHYLFTITKYQVVPAPVIQTGWELNVTVNLGILAMLLSVSTRGSGQGIGCPCVLTEVFVSVAGVNVKIS